MVEGDVRSAREALTENLCRLSGFDSSLHEGDEWGLEVISKTGLREIPLRFRKVGTSFGDRVCHLDLSQQAGTMQTQLLPHLRNERAPYCIHSLHENALRRSRIAIRDQRRPL